MDHNPYAPPTTTVADVGITEYEYAGFWIRVGASLIDTVLIVLLTLPIMYALYGEAYFEDERLVTGPLDFFFTWVLPAIVSIVFWISRQATPGKMALGLRVVDANTGTTLSTGRAIGRYAGYYVSTLLLMMGFVWVAFDKRKQGIHDKLAGTVVVKAKGPRTQPIVFND